MQFYIGLILLLMPSLNALNQEEFAEYIGYRLWKDLKEHGLSMEDVIQGMKRADRGQVSKINDEKARMLFADICAANYESTLNTNLRTSEEYLLQLKSDEKIVFLNNGKLGLEILRKGDGNQMKNSGLFHLKGTYLNGESCINTYVNEQPILQDFDNAIVGFQEGIKTMREGEKRKLYIHPDLGYGIYDLSQPNSLIILEVEFVKFID